MIFVGFTSELFSGKRNVKYFLFLKEKIKANFLLLSILSFVTLNFLFTRLYNFENRFNFDYDMEATANATWSILVDKKISLIGQETSVGGLFTGPGLHWFQTLAMFIGNLNPISLGYLGVLVSFSTMIALFLIVKEITNKWQALIAIFLFSISTRQIIYDMSANSLTYMSIFALLLYYLIFKAFIQKKNVFLPFIFLVLSLGFHIHFFLPFLYIPAVIIIFAIFRPKIETKTLLLSTIFFTLPIMTFIAFDLRHQFLITNKFLHFSSNNSFSIAQIIKTTKIHMDLLAESAFIKTKFSAAFYLIMVALFVNISRNKYRQLLLVSVTLLWSPLLALWFYNGHIPEYYFLSTIPIFLIAVSFVYYFIGKKFKIVLFLILLLVMYFNLSKFKDISESPIPIGTKKEIVDTIISKSQNKSFEVVYLLPPGLNTGFDYLFKWRGYIPRDEGENLYVVSTRDDADSIYYNSLEKFPTREVEQLKIRDNIHIVSVR